MRGNLVDMVAGIVIGLAFTATVTALVSDLVTPLIAALGGKANFAASPSRLNAQPLRLMGVPERRACGRERGPRCSLRREAGQRAGNPVPQPPEATTRQRPECLERDPSRRPPLCALHVPGLECPRRASGASGTVRVRLLESPKRWRVTGWPGERTEAHCFLPDRGSRRLVRVPPEDDPRPYSRPVCRRRALGLGPLSHRAPCDPYPMVAEGCALADEAAQCSSLRALFHPSPLRLELLADQLHEESDEATLTRGPVRIAVGWWWSGCRCRGGRLRRRLRPRV